jgi:hypothetical protein
MVLFITFIFIASLLLDVEHDDMADIEYAQGKLGASFDGIGE